MPSAIARQILSFLKRPNTAGSDESIHILGYGRRTEIDVSGLRKPVWHPVGG